MRTEPTEQRVRFGPFEADLRTGELRKHGSRIKLQDQPFQVLAILLGRPGQLVAREELQQTLWSHDTFVDFDAGVNVAIKRLRDALNDSPDSPRYIETLPRRGYRFIGVIDTGCPASAPQAEIAAQAKPEPVMTQVLSVDTEQSAAPLGRRRYRGSIIVVGVSVVLAAWSIIAVQFVRTPTPPSRRTFVLLSLST